MKDGSVLSAEVKPMKVTTSLRDHLEPQRWSLITPPSACHPLDFGLLEALLFMHIWKCHRRWWRRRLMTGS